MKYDCDVIQDLLPLYQDKICSDKSRTMVEEHISECAVCRKMAGQMGDNTVEEKLIKEKNNVLYEHQKLVNRKTTTVGMTMAGVLTIPVIICLICNIAIGHALDWFFIVLSAMLLVASMIVVPLVAETRKLMWVVLTGTASLILLLLTCCVYTRGSWFYVASSACILGISVIFAPFVVSPLCEGTRLKRHRAALVMLWDTIWLYLLLIACGFFVQGDIVYWYMAISISAYVVTLVWIYVGVISYGQKNALVKAGFLIALTGIWIGVANDVLNFLLEPVGEADSLGLGSLDLSQGFYREGIENVAVSQSNQLFLVIVMSVCIGGLMIAAGMIKEKKTHENKA